MPEEERNVKIMVWKDNKSGEILTEKNLNISFGCVFLHIHEGVEKWKLLVLIFYITSCLSLFLLILYLQKLLCVFIYLQRTKDKCISLRNTGIKTV